MKAYRKRLRAHPAKHIDAKEKDRERKRKSRATEKKEMKKMTPGCRKRLQIKKTKSERDRKRRYRQVKQPNKTIPLLSEHQSTPTKIYPTRQAAGKAMQRVRALTMIWLNRHLK